MADVAATPGRSLWQDAARRLARNRLAMGSLTLLAVVAIAVIIGPFLTGHAHDRVYAEYVRVPAGIAAHPDHARIEGALERIAIRMRVKAELVRAHSGARAGEVVAILEAPRPIDDRNLAYFERSGLFGAARVLERGEDGARVVVAAPIAYERFLLGTDTNGRDLLSRTLIAGRVSLAIGLLASLVALVIGVAWGATAGYLGGRVDLVMMRIVDILYALPFMFFVILLVVFFGRSVALMFIAVGAIEWLDMARIVRGQTLTIRAQEYVQAAEALGATTRGILWRHIIPNAIGPVIVTVTMLVPRVILLESFLSFLGLGVQEPMTSWGVLIAEGARNIQGAAYMLAGPATALVATLFALNALGDGLRDALDPKER
ncbi:MAG TPA: ABC transporter permease subunit [Hyphomicrobiaceae bacterium]|nr:ABC transporter permease subunit [Hyphomicrobiaceae bacterium]